MIFQGSVQRATDDFVDTLHGEGFAVSFYKNKCINLESLVEEHIRINRFLKEQVERMRNDAHPTN